MESGLTIKTCLLLDHPPKVRRKSQKHTGEKRTESIELRVSKEVKESVAQAARDKNLTVTVYILECIEKAQEYERVMQIIANSARRVQS